MTDDVNDVESIAHAIQRDDESWQAGRATGRDLERDAIVKWLRERASARQLIGAPMYEHLNVLAEDIDRGEHLR